jgi:hypothetical protein
MFKELNADYTFVRQECAARFTLLPDKCAAENHIVNMYSLLQICKDKILNRKSID